MANYVSNMVVCSKAFYEKYFFDTNPFGDENVSEYIKKHPYITFNKLYGVNSLNEYEDKYGVYIYYGYGHTIKDIGNNLVEIKLHWLEIKVLFYIYQFYFGINLYRIYML